MLLGELAKFPPDNDSLAQCVPDAAECRLHGHNRRLYEKLPVSMRRCFVIQPFDKGPFDQRFDDVLVPAIKDADLEAYRVDKDPSVNIPIDSIETGIQDSEVCLADISLDNPNVWFEVGYAIAAKKGVVFICSETRDTPFPFDVQHHAITKYATASPRDFNELGRKITQRLKALLKSSEELGVIAKLSPTQETEGLAPHEVAALIILMEDSISPDASTSPREIKRRMQHAGFTDIAVS
ncbi:MAG: hypothetical protein ACRD4C_13050, partial [Candidatus Acidiferrales bacterium]